MKIKNKIENLGLAVLATAFLGVAHHSISNTHSGSFVNPDTEKKTYYSFYDGPRKRMVVANTQHPSFAILSNKIRDFDKDGEIDWVGTVTYPRMPIEMNILESKPEWRDRYQRIFDLAMEDYQKKE
jgi:hypothetical protein